MNNNVIVLFARPYDLVDESTGERKQGISVSYIDATSVVKDSQNGYGYPVFKSSFPIELQEKIIEVPGVYEPVFSTYMKQGQRCSKLTNLEFVQAIDLFK